jgi:hypothetical protein
MEQSGIINQRVALYQRCSMSTNWARELPKKNWLLLVYSDDHDKVIFDEITVKAIQNDVCYICCAGRQAEQLFNIIEKEIDFREEDEGDHYLPEHFITYALQSDLRAAFKSVFFDATHEEVNIDTVVFLDASSNGIKFELDSFLLAYNGSFGARCREGLRNIWSNFSAKP